MKDKESSDGSTAGYYELPVHATELQHLIAHKNMNAQMGEIFRANYRYGEVAHSDMLRDIRKIIFYANSELDRLLRLVPKEKEIKKIYPDVSVPHCECHYCIERNSLNLSDIKIP